MRHCCGGLIVLLAAGICWADGMAIPYLPPKLFLDWSKEQKPQADGYDPLHVRVYEPGQAAVILFNGSEELLVLATTVAASQPTGILEIVPFPSQPEIKLGNADRMAALERILIEENQPKYVAMPPAAAGRPGATAFQAGALEEKPRGIDYSARISFRAKLGAHDVKTVEVLDRDFFSAWVLRYMTQQQAVHAAVRPEYGDVIERYLKRGFRWFAMDSISVSNSAESRRPIQYRFKTDEIFYPLEISSLQEGPTTIDLLMVTPYPLREFDLPYKDRTEHGLKASIQRVGLARASGAWAAFMKDNEDGLVYIEMLTLRGELRKFKEDFSARHRPA